jgi:hypothetical protein
MIVTAWHNGSPATTGAGYGVKVRREDRDRYFERSWKQVTLLRSGGEEASVSVGKDSFWNAECRELISAQIGRWLIGQGLAPWPKGEPPKLELEPLGGPRFRLHI